MFYFEFEVLTSDDCWLALGKPDVLIDD